MSQMTASKSLQWARGAKPAQSQSVSAVNRRGFMHGVAGWGMGVAAAGSGKLSSALAQSGAMARPHRIDVHHHFSPPQWLADVKGRQLLQRATAAWTPARSLEDMDNAGVAAAVPAAELGPDEPEQRRDRDELAQPPGAGCPSGLRRPGP